MANANFLVNNLMRDDHDVGNLNLENCNQPQHKT